MKINKDIIAKKLFRSKWLLCFLTCLFFVGANAQDIPQHISYSRVYDFIDELAIDKVIDINSVSKPYSRNFIAQKLAEAQTKDSLLTKCQKTDLKFFLNDYAIELDTLPKSYVHWTNKKTFDLALVQPAFQYRDKYFKCRLTPILGMDIIANTGKKGVILKRWFGADFQATIVNHVSVWASFRDNSFSGKFLKGGLQQKDARISDYYYLNNLSGCEYKEATYGGDYSDLRGGIKAYAWWGSIGLIKDNLVWGDSYSCSNIISGRAPSFPMLTLNLRPCKWFELNYIHGWLISNVADSTSYYVENNGNGDKKHYRPQNKFIAANMLTFTPIKGLNLSLGNAIIYAEKNPQAAYFIPIAYYKSIDHLLTKGLKTENQNSQIFFNVSSRNIKHLHLFGSIYLDEFNTSRLKKSNPQRNPFSYKVGFNVSNWPLKELSLQGEFTRTNIINYKHSIQSLTWASNNYNLGHYLGDNSQEIYVALNYKPVWGLNLNLSYTNARKYNDYNYMRRGSSGSSQISQILAQKPFNEMVWQNDLIAFEATYEIFNNCYAVVNVEYNNARAYTPKSEAIEGENRLTAQGYLDMYTPKFYQGKNVTVTCGLSFGF